jgi:nicotinamidase-related amidase
VENVSLIDCGDSILAVIDVQQAFTAKVGQSEARPLVARIRFLVQVAAWLDIPIVVTAEDMDVLGGTVPRVAEVLPGGTKQHNKMVFGLGDDPEILAAVEDTRRRTAVLVGLETDVCVAHSALGLLDRGYRVVVPHDAVGCPGTAHVAGLERMRAAGAVVTTTKTLLYEWLRGVEASKRFRAECPAAREVPEGVIL